MTAISRFQPVLVLSGFMGAGKTTVGREVAARAGVPFIDLDTVIEERAGKRIEAIFADGGEGAFRAVEAAALGAELARKTPAVVAVGGGALVDPVRRRDTLGRAFVATLSARPETLAARTAGSPRPLLAVPDRPARIRELLAARADAYAEAHVCISTDDRAIDAIAADVLAAWSRPTIAVALGPRSYRVRFARRELALIAEAVAELAPSGVFVVTDRTVAELWGRELHEALAAAGVAPRATVVLEPGERHKRLAAVESALAAMVEAGADRHAVVLGHGGGVVTDIAGFAAATLFRGVRWVAAPTTLLAMVDASVGGKTGVDLGFAKNAIGAFHQPSAVVIDVAHTTTEEARAYVGGLAEVVKSACVGDAALFERLEADPVSVLARDADAVEELAFRSVAVKAAIVARDERESGDRVLLNFGHTIGHALEAQGDFERLTHGEAVSLGMMAILQIGCALGVTRADVAARVGALLDRLALPVDLEAQPLAQAWSLIGLDKKRRGSDVRAVLLREVGQASALDLPVGRLPELFGAGAIAEKRT